MHVCVASDVFLYACNCICLVYRFGVMYCMHIYVPVCGAGQHVLCVHVCGMVLCGVCGSLMCCAVCFYCAACIWLNCVVHMHVVHMVPYHAACIGVDMHVSFCCEGIYHCCAVCLAILCCVQHCVVCYVCICGALLCCVGALLHCAVYMCVLLCCDVCFMVLCSAVFIVLCMPLVCMPQVNVLVCA